MKISYKQETKRSLSITCEPIGFFKQIAIFLWGKVKSYLGV